MTEEKFKTYIQDVVEELEKKLRYLEEKAEYLIKINSNNKYYNEYNELKMQSNIVLKQIQSLKRIVSFPAYERIQLMSDLEVEKYKNDKIETIETKIQNLELEEETLTQKLSQIEKEIIVNIEDFHNDKENEKTINNGKNLETERIRVKARIKDIEKEKEELKQQQKTIKKMSSQDVKMELVSKLKVMSYDLQNLEFASKSDYTVDKFTELAASVAMDYEKAHKLAGAMADYREWSEKEENLQETVSNMWAPKKHERETLTIVQKHSKGGATLDDGKSPITVYVTPDEVIERYQEYKKEFEQDKASFDTEFTEEKLLGLAGKDEEENITAESDDMYLLQLHANKIETNELEQLKNLYEQRKKMSVFRLFKKKEIEELNKQIKKLKSKIYKEIIGWYKLQCKDLLKYRGEIYFYSVDRIKECLKYAKEDMEYQASGLEHWKENIDNSLKRYNENLNNYKRLKQEAFLKFIELGEGKYTEKDFEKLPYFDEDYRRNLETIVRSYNNVEYYKIVNKTKVEAKKLADGFGTGGPAPGGR